MENPDQLNEVTAVLAGLALSASAGLRVFLPLLALAIGMRLGYVDPGAGFEWLAHPMILVVLGTASLAEIGAYFFPWVDNLLDTVATPAAIGSGTVIASALLPEMNAALQWGLGFLLGGGSAGVVQGATVLARGASTATSGGAANPAVATAETGGSIATAGLVFLVPWVVGGLAVLAVGYLLFRLIRMARRRKPPESRGQSA
jgi:hypothetical protein